MIMIFRNYKKENKELREKNNELEGMIINLKGELKATKMQLDKFCTKEDGSHNPSIICNGCRNLVSTFDWGRTIYLCALDNKCKDKEVISNSNICEVK